jgi:hypothetical protein
LRVLNPRKSMHGVHLEISWKGDNTAHVTKKRMLNLTSNFTIELRIQSDEAIDAADMAKHIDTAKKQCSEAAAKGFTDTSLYIFDCLFTPEEVASEIELLGLRVLNPRRCGHCVRLDVSWKNTVDSFEPNGLARGNLLRSCSICLHTEVMCRLHPCGHILGQSCAKDLMSCPCCRSQVRFAQVIFEP